jgi:hypothetical protein
MRIGTSGWTYGPAIPSTLCLLPQCGTSFLDDNLEWSPTPAISAASCPAVMPFRRAIRRQLTDVKSQW